MTEQSYNFHKALFILPFQLMCELRQVDSITGSKLTLEVTGLKFLFGKTGQVYTTQFLKKPQPMGSQSGAVWPSGLRQPE